MASSPANAPSESADATGSSPETNETADALEVDDLRLNDDDSGSSSSDCGSDDFSASTSVLSPALVAEFRQYAQRVDELREVARQRLVETRETYDEHNALVETREFVRKETALLDSLYVQIVENRNEADEDVFASRGRIDASRFALEASLRKAKISTDAVCARSSERLDDLKQDAQRTKLELDETARKNEAAEVKFAKLRLEIRAAMIASCEAASHEASAS